METDAAEGEEDDWQTYNQENWDRASFRLALECRPSAVAAGRARAVAAAATLEAMAQARLDDEQMQ
jgi:hypothetical protein